jgi:uncharacterized protein YjbJ (UPF0337 family)
MNIEELKGNWQQIKGKARAKWGELTDDDLEHAQGNREVLEGKIRERYGKSKDEARREVDAFFDSL